jgi:sec-independent protein translocase protein TatA
MGEGLFQPLHLLVIAGIALLVFGPKKLPELGKGLGQAIRGFKTAMTDGASTPSIDDTPAARLGNGDQAKTGVWASTCGTPHPWDGLSEYDRVVRLFAVFTLLAFIVLRLTFRLRVTRLVLLALILGFLGSLVASLLVAWPR